MLSSYTVDIAQGDRTADLRGSAEDLRYIFGVQFGTGESQGPLAYIGPTAFLKKYDSPIADQGLPTIYTELVSVDGFPQIKFDVPSSTATTITVYYYSEVTADNVHRVRSASTVVNGTLAYFYGIGSKKGRPYYENFEHLAKLALSSDSFTRLKSSQFTTSQRDLGIHNVQSNFKRKR